MNTVLAVEDSTDSFELIRRSLGSSVGLEWVKTVAEADRRLKSQKYDLILLDITLPDGDGFKLCSMLQASDDLKHIPVIFLTAKTASADKVMGFSLGAEDFVSKPFDPMDLKARVDAKLRRVIQKRMQFKILSIGDLEINRDSQRVFIHENGESVEIQPTPIEFKILLYLATRPGRVVSRDEMLKAVWGDHVHVYRRSVDTHVSKLKKKLGQKTGLIKCVHRAGYRFEIEEREKKTLSFGADCGLPAFSQPLQSLKSVNSVTL